MGALVVLRWVFLHLLVSKIKQKTEERKKNTIINVGLWVFPCRHGWEHADRETIDQPKQNGFKSVVGNNWLESRTRKQLVFMIFLFVFFYKCVKENASEKSLMMLFFYLLNNMPSMSLKLWLWVSLESVDIAVASDVSFYFLFVFLFRQNFQ